MTRILIFSLIILTSLGFSHFASASNDLSVNSLRSGSQNDGSRVVIDLSQKSEFRAFLLQDPTRIVVDLPSFQWNVKPAPEKPGSVIKSIRSGMLQPGISRIVIETSRAVDLKSAFSLPAGTGVPDRIVIDLKPVSGTQTTPTNTVFGSLTTNPEPAGKIADLPRTPAPGTPDKGGHTLKLPPSYQPPVNDDARTIATPGSSRAGKPAPKTADEPSPRDLESRPNDPTGRKLTIVIDPGHGGQDPGSPGVNGTREKDVTLAAAKELARQLQATGRYNVRLTRSTDIFIKLQDRVAIGRKQGADLFISLHADSIDRSGVSGASIYTLSNTASDAQTAKLATRENRADLIAGVDLSHEDKEVANILIDLAMRDTMNQSKYFANLVVREAARHGIELLEKPHRFAGFAVLKAPDVPSVLIEMGFMSNRREVAQLNSQDHREKLAATIVQSIDNYFAKMKNSRN